MKLKKENRKRHKRVPFWPHAGLCESSSLRHFFYQFFLPTLGTILAERFFLPEKTIGRRSKRAAFCAFSQASLTVEAAFAVPFMFMCVICVISIINVYGLVLDRAAALRDTAMTAALVTGAEVQEREIDLNVPVLFRPYFFPEGTGTVIIPCRACVRVWNGMDEKTKAEGKNSASQYVYVTDNKSVYHTSASCTHLDLSVRAVQKQEAGRMKNVYGQHYHACEKCASAGEGGVVYITSCGECWHTDPDCAGLKRSILLVDKNELNGSLCQCSRCAARAA